MPHDRSKAVKLGTIRTLFLSCFAGLLLLETGLAILALRYNVIQSGVLKDQATLLRSRELLNDALHDARRMWNTSPDSDLKPQQPQSPPPSATQATEAIALLQKLARPSLAFPAADFDRLEDTLSNNLKLLSLSPPYTADQKALMEKTETHLSAFIAAIDIRLFASMQEFRREVEFLEMTVWGLLPLLILSTAAFGFLLHAKVMEPLVHLKKQSRKLTESIVNLQKELRIGEMEKTPSLPAVKPLEEPVPAPAVDLPEEPVPVEPAPLPQEPAPPLPLPPPGEPPLTPAVQPLQESRVAEPEKPSAPDNRETMPPIP